MQIACENRHDEFILRMAGLPQCQRVDAQGNTFLHAVVMCYGIDSDGFDAILQAVAASSPDAIASLNMNGETSVSLLLAKKSNKVFSSLQVLYGVSAQIMRKELSRLQGATTTDLTLLLEEVDLETVTVHLLGNEIILDFCN